MYVTSYNIIGKVDLILKADFVTQVQMFIISHPNLLLLHAWWLHASGDHHFIWHFPFGWKSLFPIVLS